MTLQVSQNNQRIDDKPFITDAEKMEAIHEALIRIQNKMNNNPDNPVDPNVFVDLYANVPNQTSLSISRNYDRAILVQNILFSIPAAATGTLQIGSRIIPLTPSTIIPDLTMIVLPVDIITLTSNTQGNLYLEIMGRSLRGDSWRVIS